MYRLGFRHRPEYVRDRKAIRGMTYDEEVGLEKLLNISTRCTRSSAVEGACVLLLVSLSLLGWTSGDVLV